MIYKRKSNGKIAASSFNDRFYSKIFKNSVTGCWDWLAAKDKNGYGLFGRKKAHRVAYELNNNKIPPGMFVCHSCDNPSCTNPEHLWVGSASDNAKDRSNKGRNKLCGVSGSKHYATKFSDIDICNIKKRLVNGEKQKDIAKDYGVCHQTISNIKRGLAWKDDRNFKPIFKPRLKEDDVKNIKKLHKKGMFYRDIAIIFDISLATISHIITGKSWRHIP